MTHSYILALAAPVIVALGMTLTAWFVVHRAIRHKRRPATKHVLVEGGRHPAE